VSSAEEVKWNLWNHLKSTSIKNQFVTQHWLTLNITYVNWCRLSSETQISSTDCPTNNPRPTLSNSINLLSVISFHCLVMRAIAQLIAGYTLAVSLCALYAERHLASLILFQLFQIFEAVCVTAKFCSSTVREPVIKGCRSTKPWVWQDTSL
jgi:hypothetical protein